MRLLVTAIFGLFVFFAGFYQSHADTAVVNNSIEAVENNVDAVVTEEAAETPSEVLAENIENSESKEIVLDTQKAESEIPVLTQTLAKKKENESPFFRLIVSLLVIAALCVGGLFFSKWWSKNYRPQQETNRIRVVNQHFLGPKKSLAIVRVAGESILIGITEQNISHIKTLSLLEEEVEGATEREESEETSASFKTTLNKKSFELADGEEFRFGNVKDRFSLSGRNEV